MVQNWMVRKKGTCAQQNGSRSGSLLVSGEAERESHLAGVGLTGT